MQHQLQRRPAGFHREVPQEKAPPRRRPGSARSKTHRGGPVAAPEQGRGLPGPCLPLLQVRPLPARPGIPPEAPSWWHILLWPSRAEVGQGAGKENKASAPNDVTLSSSKTLAFVSLPSFPINKFPRAVRVNWPRSPESGRDQAVPRPLVRGRPGAGRFHTSRADKARDQAGHEAAPVPPRTPTSAAGPAQLAPRASPVPAPRTRPRPPGPPRTAPRPRHNPRAGPGARERRAARRAATRLPQRPRFLLQFLPRITDSTSRQASRRRGIWDCECGAWGAEARARPAQPPVHPLLPLGPTFCCGLGAPPLPPGSAPPSGPRPPCRPESDKGRSGALGEPRRPQSLQSRFWRPCGNAIPSAYYDLADANCTLGYISTVTGIITLSLLSLSLVVLLSYSRLDGTIWGQRWQTGSPHHSWSTPIPPGASICAVCRYEIVNKLCEFWKRYLLLTAIVKYNTNTESRIKPVYNLWIIQRHTPL